MINQSNSIEINEQFKKAISIMEGSDKSVFITGKAGTGKSTLLHYFRKKTRKNIVVLAPTGVAALNVKGQTIHSFFNFKPDITLDKVKDIVPRNKDIYKKLDAIVIDEISMVRADLLDCVDTFLRRHGKRKNRPFGGIQMIFIGDLYQLPPIVTVKEREFFDDYYASPYFFDSMVFKGFTSPLLETTGFGIEMEFIELEKVYRQQDDLFLEVLNAIRNNTADWSHLEKLNTRYNPDFCIDGKDFYIYLATTNQLVDAINNERLTKLRGKTYTFKGQCDGDFNLKDMPTAKEIALKIGAQVMLLNNDPEGRWINGTIGRVSAIETLDSDYDAVWVECPDGRMFDVVPYTWELFEFSFDKSTKRILSNVVGRFVQYPIKLAWAITIHKSQGMTFDNMIIDIGRGTFSHGQLYVALSRCTSLNGIILKKPLQKKHILMDRRVVEFLTKYQYMLSAKKNPRDERIRMIEMAIKENKSLEIVYLKTKDEKTRRSILPTYIGDMEYQGKKFTGVKAYCTLRGSERVFHLDRILEINVSD